MKIFKNKYLNIFYLFLLTEVLSFIGFLYPVYNKAFFLILCLTIFVISFIKIEYGIYLIIAELVVGSKGYLFYWSYGENVISIRIAFWLIVMSVWACKELLDIYRKKTLPRFMPNFIYDKYFWLLFFFIGWGLFNSFLNHNQLSNTFFDFNNWLFFALLFPARKAIKSDKQIKNLLSIVVIGSVLVSLKTFLILYGYSHNITFVINDVYKWVRTSGVGEITLVKGGFYRVFFQSHIYALISFFCYLFYFNQKSTFSHFAILSLFLTTLIISFSRSFWAGLVFGIIAFLILLFFKIKTTWNNLFYLCLKLAGVIITSIVLMIFIVKFPFPKPVGGFDATDLISERASQLSGEAGAASRWSLLPILWKEIERSPIIGQGFGATATYISSDPRILEKNPTGEYTTYAFEWGWMDIWLKMGLVGMLVYLVLIFKIIYDGIFTSNSLLVNGFAVSMVAIIAVHFFSPYFNHPLGIGFVILSAIIINYIKKTKFNLKFI